MSKQKPKLSVIAFRADADVHAAVEKLVAALDARGMAPSSARAVALRRAILDAAARLNGGAK